MSTKPGVTYAPSASIVRVRPAVDLADLDDAVAVDRDVARERPAPVPSTIVPPRITRSCGHAAASRTGQRRYPGPCDCEPTAPESRRRGPRRRSREHDYLADEGLATSIFLALRLRRPLLLEGEAGVGKTEVAKVLAALDRRRARAAPVLRGHRRDPGRLRVGLLAPAAAPARGRGERRARSTRTSCTPSASS